MERKYYNYIKLNFNFKYYRFEFFDVLPGQYTVKGSHDHWKFLTVNQKKENGNFHLILLGNITCTIIKRTMGN
jgi:hypothetical protein